MDDLPAQDASQKNPVQTPPVKKEPPGFDLPPVSQPAKPFSLSQPASSTDNHQVPPPVKKSFSPLPAPPSLPNKTKKTNTTGDHPLPTQPAPAETAAPLVYKKSNSQGRLVKVSGAILALFLLAGGVYFSLNLLKKSPTKDESQGQSEKKTTSLRTGEALQLAPGETNEILAWQKPDQMPENQSLATEILSWLDNQRDSRGVYIHGYRCSLDGNCLQQEPDNRAGLAAIWGRFVHFQQTKDPHDLAVLTQDLETYTNPEKVAVIQNNFWNCRLMYQLWQNSLLSAEQKEQAKNICFKSAYYPPDLEMVNNEIENGQFQPVQPLEVIHNTPTLARAPQTSSNKSAKFVESSTYSSDFTTRYLWEKDPLDLKRGQAYFKKALLLWQNEPRDNYLEAKSLLALASLDLYQATQKQAYLDFALSFLNQEKIEEFCLAPLGQEDNHYNSSLLEHVTAGLLLQELGQLKGGDYFQRKQALVNSAKTNLLNYPQYTDQKGKNAFFGQTEINGQITIFKSVRKNGLMVGLLMLNQ